MDVLYPIVAGIDVHKDMMAVCLRKQTGAKISRETLEFGTMVSEIFRLLDWLVANDCPIAIIESTGVYWQPVFNILEGSVKVILANASEVKAMPGRKTDLRDAEWLADLGAHGLVKASFIPPAVIRDLRELTRYRKALQGERTSAVNRLQKVLEQANIKLGSVVSDVLGVTGTAIVEAIIAGERDPEKMALLAKGSLQKKIKELAPALVSDYVRPHHRFMLKEILGHLREIETRIENLDKEVARLCTPFEVHIQNLATLPGVARITAEVIIAEIGADMSQFPTPQHLASWARLCPGNNESAGKRRTGRTLSSQSALKTALVQAAWAASRTKGSYYQRLYRHYAHTRGKGGKKAAVAVAHAMLIACWHIIKNQVPYKEPALRIVTETEVEQRKQKLIKQLRALGCEVTVTTPVAA